MSGAREAIAIFDAVAEMARQDARLYKMSELRKSIRHQESTCGSCRLWMTDACPLERLMPNGFKRGPHMNYPICSKFTMKPWVTEDIEKMRAELAVLSTPASPAATSRRGGE